MLLMSTDVADPSSIKDNVPIAVIDATFSHSFEKASYRVCFQATDYVVEANDNVQEGVVNVPTFEDFLQEQATDPFCQPVAARVRKVKAK